MTWLLAIISLAGSILNSRKLIASFYVWILCNVGWGIYDALTGNYARVALDALQTFFCVYGIRNWRKKPNDRESKSDAS